MGDWVEFNEGHECSLHAAGEFDYVDDNWRL